MGSNLDKLRQANNKNINKTKNLQRVNLIDTVINDNTVEESNDTTTSNENVTEQQTITNTTEAVIPEPSNTDEMTPQINNIEDEVIPTPTPTPTSMPMQQPIQPNAQMPTLDIDQYNMLYTLLNRLPSQQTGVQYNAFKQSTQFTPEKEEYRKNIQESVSQWSSISPKGKRVKNKILSIRVYPEIYDRIEMIALQNGCSLNEVMNILLAQLFNIDLD